MTWFTAHAIVLQGASVEERLSDAGGVPKALVDAFASLLRDEEVDPALTAAAISMPAASEIVDIIHEADPVTLHLVRSALQFDVMVFKHMKRWKEGWLRLWNH